MLYSFYTVEARYILDCSVLIGYVVVPMHVTICGDTINNGILSIEGSALKKANEISTFSFNHSCEDKL